jgi:S-DNA-T family DNA segregation ATPase FtsK/SpoIIIE
MTKQKIIRLELYLLFLFTFFSFLYFYFQDVFPDSYLSISSESRYFNFVFYYASSFVAMIGFYSGIWIFFPFFTLSLAQNFLFSKRKFSVDALAFLCFAGFFLTFAHTFYPSLIGGGLLSWMNEKFHIFFSFLGSLTFFNLSMLICYREKYVKFLQALYENILVLFQRTQPVVSRNFNLVENKVIETYPKVKSAAKLLAQKCSQVWQRKESTSGEEDVITMEPVTSRSQLMEERLAATKDDQSSDEESNESEFTNDDSLEEEIEASDIDDESDFDQDEEVDEDGESDQIRPQEKLVRNRLVQLKNSYNTFACS